MIKVFLSVFFFVRDANDRVSERNSDHELSTENVANAQQPSIYSGKKKVKETFDGTR